MHDNEAITEHLTDENKLTCESALGRAREWMTENTKNAENEEILHQIKELEDCLTQVNPLLACPK